MNVDEHNGSIDSGYYEFEESREETPDENAEMPVPLEVYEPVEESRLVISAVGDIMMHMPQIRSAQQSDGSYDFRMFFKR